MDSVKKVKEICKERKIPISKLEKDLGFSNGYISQLKKGVFPSDRLKLIAKYLGLPISYFLNGNETDMNDELLFALFGTTEGITDEMFEDVKKYARFVLSNSKSEREGK